MEYTYKICLTCDSSGYNRETKVRCKDCDGKGIKISSVDTESSEEEKEHGSNVK